MGGVWNLGKHPVASGEGQYPLLFVVAVDDKRAGAEKKKKIARVGGGIGCAGHAPFGTASDGGYSTL